MSEKRQNTNQKEKMRGSFLIPIFVFLSLLFLLLSMIGLFGTTLKGVFLGVFGFSGYALVSLAIILFVVKSLHVLKKGPKARTVAFTVVLAVLFFVYLQIITSHAEFSDLETATFSSYLSVCFKAGVGTSGGWLFAIPAFPLLSLMGKYSAIAVAVVFFVVLFFAMFPMMRGAVSAGKSYNRAERKAPQAKPASSEKALRLFVDKVRPGQKDAQKIKMRGLFAKKGPEPEFFDYTDPRPLTASEGVVPEPQPTQFDVYGGNRPTDDDDSYDDYSYSAGRDQARNPHYEEDAPEDDMPAFVRRYASDRAQANRALYGDDTLKGIPDEPQFNVKTPAEDAASEPAPAPEQPPVMKPLRERPGRSTPRLDGIIESMSDLQRMREKEGNAATKRTTFIGEEAPKETPSAPQEPAAPISPVVDLPEEPAPAMRTPEPTPEPEEPKKPSPFEFRPLVPPTITPRESSYVAPVEEPAEEKPVVKIAPQPEVTSRPSDAFEADTPLARPMRKPRSDIGGTHHTREESGYIDPKKVQQMNIDQIAQQEEEQLPPARPYTPPPVSLLTDYPTIQDDEDVDERGRNLVQALASFHINSEVVDHKTGPTFTQFAVTLPDNMSVNKLTPLEKDIKRKLKVDKNIRIIPSVPGLDAVGIEVPNAKTSMVGLRSIINSPDFAKEGKLYFAIGVNVSGKAIYGDLLKMPHLLVAGSTGSGKSVALNVMITSIMYHYSPEFVRFIMVDPKKVELSVYKDMPHMLMPSTVTETDKAVNALNWAVNEMERRYQLLGENGCRNLGEYNAMQKKKGEKGLYYIVFIVDEMADLMLAAKREVEEKISRITAKARAAGIHLVIATQRPSVDVITGTIKNNIPSRIAFKVTSFTDSKTILDRGGAESLFGNGDMLYMAPEGGDPIRLQGPYINDEIGPIVSFIKEHNDARYDSAAEKVIQADKEVPAENTKGQESENEDDGEDPLFGSALLYFINNGQASISKLQIKYHIGYGRAARIVETMAERGYLGPAEAGNKSRQVIITLDEYYQLYGEDGIDGDEAR